MLIRTKKNLVHLKSEILFIIIFTPPFKTRKFNYENQELYSTA